MQNNDPQSPGETPVQGQPGESVTAELENLQARVAELEANNAELRETVLREHAELENQRRRLHRDLEQARRFANEKLLSDLLPVIDNLERGLAAEAADASALRSGVELTLRELIRVTSAGGLKAAGAIGEAFDPERHQAMNMVEDAAHASGSIVAVMQKGYLLNDRLLRPALVSVAR